MRRAGSTVARRTLHGLFYAILPITATWPLVLHLGDRVPNDPGDSLLNVFLLAWNARELPLTDRWWNLPQFYPAPGAMAFSEHLLGLSVLATPAIWLSGNPLLGYNLAFLLSFPLCGLAAHALVFQITRRHDVSLVAGMAFAFAPYRMSQLAHVQVLSSYWMPLALLGLHRFLDERRWRWLALFAASWALQALACGYYLFYLSVLVVAWILWFAVGRVAWRDLVRLAGVWLLAAAALAPVAFGYIRHLGFYGFARGREEIESFSADLASVLSASGNLVVWGWLEVFGRAEGTLFPGAAIVLTIAAGGASAWRAAARAGSPGRTPQVLAACACVFAAGGIATVWLGPWRLEFAGVRLLSAATAGKPFAFAAGLAAVAVAAHPAGRAAWRQRAPLAFYAAAAVLMWLFALGPAPTVLGHPLFDPQTAPYYAPYAWLMMLPGVDGVRVPARFWTLASLCLAVAAAIAAARLLPRTRHGAAVSFVMAACIVLEGWPEGVRLVIPPAPRPLASAAVARLEIPMGPGYDVAALYRAAGHRLPVFNGYSGYFPPHHGVLMQLVADRHPDVLARLASTGPIEVLVDHASDPSGGWRAFVGRHPGVSTAEAHEEYTLYLLPAEAPSPAHQPDGSVRLPVAAIRASIHPADVPLMTDGDLATRWHTGPQAPGNELVVDLGVERRVEVLELQLGPFTADYPRHLVVDLSADGAAWTPVWDGATAAHAMWAAIERPRTLPLRFALGGGGARYIRMRQTSRDPVYYWSIAELRLYGG